MSYEKTLLNGDDRFMGKKTELKSPEVEYFTVGDFKALGIDQGLNFNEGISVQVLDKAPNGWWYGKIEGEEGWIPSSFLGKREKEPQASQQPRSPRMPRRPEPPRQSQKNEKQPEVGMLKPAQLRSNAKKPLSPSLPRKHVPSQQTEAKPADFRSNLQAVLSAHASPRESGKPAASSESAESYSAIADFSNDSEGFISFREGDIARVIEKNDEGWWFVAMNGKEGWAPSSYLTKVERKASVPPARPKPPQKPRETKADTTGKTSKPSPKVFPSAKQKLESSSNMPPRPLPGNSSSTPFAFPAKPGSSNTAPVPVPNRPTAPTRPKPKPKPRTKPKQSDVTQASLTLSGLSISAEKTVCIAIASYVHDGTDGLSFHEGDEFEFREDSNTGWWLVRLDNGLENWAPASYLEKRLDRKNSTEDKPTAPKLPPKPAPVKQAKPVYVALASYQDDDDEALSFKEGDQMELLEQDDGGWWLVHVNGTTGWAPSNFLKPVK